MENPTFHLEGVVKSREETQDFEGPLSLILMLLQKNKIEIRDISISEILDQYLAYLAEMERMDLEVASEFVQMAAYLLYIKTRTLLAVEEEVTELEQLMTSLEKLRAKDAREAVKSVLPTLAEYSAEGKLPGPPELRALAPQRIVYGVRDKSREILRILGEGPATLRSLYAAGKSRSEVVATFLSVLELCSMGSVLITEQEGELLLSFAGGDTESIIEAIEE